MNTIIKQLSQIEDENVRLLAEAAERKKTLAAEYEEKTKQFDETLNQETEEQIEALRTDLEKTFTDQLAKQKADALASIKRLENHYEAAHLRYVDRLFQSMTEV